jgi:osmotically-inducible protein OsmY
MTRNACFGAALVAALAVTLVPAARAATVDTLDLTPQFRAAGLNVDALRAVEVGGIVVLRGRTEDRAVAEKAGTLARSLGYQRVANLIQVIEPPDDEAIRRMAERQLGLRRSLDGCKFLVASNGGVVHLSGQVQYELQKDVAISVVRQIDGVREVKSDFQR